MMVLRDRMRLIKTCGKNSGEEMMWEICYMEFMVWKINRKLTIQLSRPRKNLLLLKNLKWGRIMDPVHKSRLLNILIFLVDQDPSFILLILFLKRNMKKKSFTKWKKKRGNHLFVMDNVAETEIKWLKNYKKLIGLETKN